MPPLFESTGTDARDVIATLSPDDLRIAARWLRLLRYVVGDQADMAGDLVALREHLEEVVCELPGRDPNALEIMTLRYGLGSEDPSPVDRVAKRFGYTRERVRRVEEEVIRRLRHPRHSRSIRSGADGHWRGRHEL
jgi:DNA-directed RNA polymerase sigma subunit (sigma70/sigma32)